MDVGFRADKRLPNQQHKLCMIMVDAFSKYLTVTPLLNNKTQAIGSGILKSFELQGKQPAILFSDSEGSLFSKEIQQMLDEANVQLVLTTTHAPFIERAVRTFKSMLFKRIERKQQLLKKRVTGKTSDDIQWVDYINSVLNQYNSSIHSATELSPIEARKKSNEISVKINLEMRARRNVKYPDLQVGDSVRILKNKKSFEKENVAPFGKKYFYN